MTDNTHMDGLLPALDGGAGPALPINEGTMQAMIDTAIADGLVPGGGGDGPAGGDGGLGASGAGGAATAAKLGLAGVGVGAAVIAAVVMTGVHTRAPLGATGHEVPKQRASEARIELPVVEPERVLPHPPPPPPPRLRGERGLAPARRSVATSRKAKAPEDLLRRANQARKRRAWRQADGLYRRVLRDHPGSRAAYVAAVASAQLNLAKLGMPATALRLFRRALRRGGFLTEEARYGVAQALRKLGKRAAEKSALETFLRHHADSALAPRARARLGALSGGNTR